MPQAVELIRLNLYQYLQTMHQNGLEPSASFWQSLLKMLSSRKHFNTVVAAYSIFDKRSPANKVINSCLTNAASDCEQPQMAAHMLARYGKSELEAASSHSAQPGCSLTSRPALSAWRTPSPTTR